MQELKIIFVGLGSIAKRHIRNLKTICQERKISLTIDAFRHSVGAMPIEGICHIYHGIKQVPEDYDVVFITNPTEFHFESLKMFREKGRHFFIEKPVISLNQIRAAKHFVRRKRTLYYVACPLRYNAVIQYIKRNIQLEEVISIRSISSSYLPDWRKGQDYRDTYSAHKKLGGGVSVDLIHEWDYLTYLFGWPQKVSHFLGKKSSLEIDSDDYAVYIAEHDKYILELHLDYFGRKTIREIQIFTEKDTIIGDIANNKISYLCEGKVIDFQEDRDDFQRRELAHFLDMIDGLVTPEDGYRHGIDVLELTQGEDCPMGKLIDEEKNILETVLHQLNVFWKDIDESIVSNALPGALKSIKRNFETLSNPRFFDGNDVLFSPYVSIQWMIFLYRLSHEIFKLGGGIVPKEADMVYYLNKVLHSNDWFYAIELPTLFLCEHPVGSVLGRAKYGEHLFIYQGTTIGGNRSGEKLYYPVLGDNVILYANSTILGNTHIGNNVVISSDTYIINEEIPDNCIVFGKSPNLVIKKKTESEIKAYTAHIWNWG